MHDVIIKDMEKNKLWTRDFTIITLGSVVSMFGNAMSGFALSLMVLDFTESTLFYAIYLMAFTIPQIIMPILSGAYLDRFSRKKVIYTLDFLSAFLYVIAGYVLIKGWFYFPLFAIYVFVIGSIQSIYMTAYQSFYPLLITEGNFSKAYSISSVLETMSALMVPVATFAYHQVGIGPLLYINAVCFLIAAIMETQIKTKEKYVETRAVKSENRVAQMKEDIKEGGRYLKAERGLLIIAVYFTFTAMTYGVTNVLTLPYFRKAYTYGEYIFMLVQGMAMAGRGIGGALLYRLKIPVMKKFKIAFMVYILTNVLEAVYLFMPVPVAMAMCFVTGISGVTSYTIRISATQSYVPDDKKGRFNGMFNMLNTCGSLVGEMLAGIAGLLLPPRMIIAIFMMINLMAAIVLMGKNKDDIALIYNREQ